MKVKWQSDAPNMELKVPSEIKIDGYIPTAEDLKFTGIEFQTVFSYGKMDWLLNHYKNRIQTEELTSLNFGLSNHNNITDLSVLVLNLKSTSNYICNALFKNDTSLEKLPQIKTKEYISPYGCSGTKEMFFSCTALTNVPFTFFDNIYFNNPGLSVPYQEYQSMFENCINLEYIDCRWMSRIPVVASAYSYSPYSRTFTDCYMLKQIENIGINNSNGKGYTSETFSQQTFRNNKRLQRITFVPNQIAYWKKQTLQLQNVGWGEPGNYQTPQNQIKDEVTYHALKNNPQAWTATSDYAFYNHDSAVETINSLPDTSAYLAENGGTNTIKFMGKAGSKTDGGAIDTMTAEEIAVAAAKGWTVTFV